MRARTRGRARVASSVRLAASSAYHRVGVRIAISAAAPCPPPPPCAAARSYGSSKLANVWHARELQRRYGGQGLTVVSLHPGNIASTSLGRYLGLGTVLTMIRHLTPSAVWMLLTSDTNKTVPQGVATSVYCALAPALEPGACGGTACTGGPVAPWLPALRGAGATCHVRDCAPRPSSATSRPTGNHCRRLLLGLRHRDAGGADAPQDDGRGDGGAAVERVGGASRKGAGAAAKVSATR